MNISISHWNATGVNGIRTVNNILINELVARGHNVTLIYNWNSCEPPPKFPIPETVEHLFTRLALQTFNDTDPEFIKLKEQYIARNNDVHILTVSNNTCLPYIKLLMNLNIPILLALHHNPDAVINNWWTREEFFSCMTGADRIQILSPAYREMCPQFLRDRIRVIPNAIKLGDPYQIKDSRGSRRNKILLGIGRISERSKRFSLLIQAYAQLLPEFPDWKLCLCGNGPSMKYIQRLVASLNLQNLVSLPGMVTDTASYYNEADLFCIPSALEGFPMTLLEANSYGLPAVGFAKCIGVNEIILPGENGLLAEEMTAECLAEKLAVLMRDESLRLAYGERARELCSRYDPQLIFDQWEKLLVETAECKGNTRMQQLQLTEDEEEQYKTRLKDICYRPGPFVRYAERELEDLQEKLKKEKQLRVQAEEKIASKSQKQPTDGGSMNILADPKTLLTKKLGVFYPSSANSLQHPDFTINAAGNFPHQLWTLLLSNTKLPVTAAIPAEAFAQNSQTKVLADLFTQYGSDKARHEYTGIYSRILSSFAGKSIKILEIGLGTNDPNLISTMGVRGKPGASLRAFRDYLPMAQIFGADVDKNILFTEERIVTTYVDQTQFPSFLQMADQFQQSDFDLIIDDGLHSTEANINSLLFGMQYIAENGFIVIEDIPERSTVVWNIISKILDQEMYHPYILKAKSAYMFVVQRIK